MNEYEKLILEWQQEIETLIERLKQQDESPDIQNLPVIEKILILTDCMFELRRAMHREKAIGR